MSRSIWEERWLPKASCADLVANGHFGAEIMGRLSFLRGTTIADGRQSELMPTRDAALALQEIAPMHGAFPLNQTPETNNNAGRAKHCGCAFPQNWNRAPNCIRRKLLVVEVTVPKVPSPDPRSGKPKRW